MKEVIVFKAAWCGPCKVYAPVIEDAKADIEAKGYAVRFVDADSETDKEVFAKYGIRGVPSTVIVNEMGGSTMLVGKKTKEELLASLV